MNHVSKRTMKRFFAALLAFALVLLIPMGAYADLKRGDSGEDVYNLQQLLCDTGFLFDEPDGQFGYLTEDAVKAYQRYALLEVTGIADEQTVYELGVTREAMFEEKGYVPFCYSWQDESGQVYCEFCQRHALLWEATTGMLADGYADSAEYSYYEWQAEVISLYNEWIMLTEGSAQAEIEASKALCIQMMNAQFDTMKAVYTMNDVDIDPTDIYYSMELWMRAHSAWLCEMISTLEAE